MDQGAPIFCSTRKGLRLIASFTSYRYLYLFQRYLRWKSKVVKGRCSLQCCTRVITSAQRHVTWQSFIRLLPVAPKILRLIRWILSQFLTPHWKKRDPDGGALTRLGHSLARVKILGRSTPWGLKYGLPKKDWNGHDSTVRSPKLVDQSSPNFFGWRGRNCCRPRSILVWFWISSSVPNIFAVEHWSCPKSRQILDVFGPWIFWGSSPPKFWTGIIKFGPGLINFAPIGRRISEVSRWKEKKNICSKT